MEKKIRDLSVRVLLAGGAAALSLTSQASAQSTPPRGVDVSSVAAACGVAKVPQTSKAGLYNDLCEELSDAEKCLAIIKDQMRSDDYTFSPINSNRQKDKMRACIAIMQSDFGLIASEDSNED